MANRKHWHSIYLVSHDLHLAKRPAPDNLDGFEAVSCEPARLNLLDYLGVWSRAQANEAAQGGCGQGVGRVWAGCGMQNKRGGPVCQLAGGPGFTRPFVVVVERQASKNHAS